MPSMNYCLFHNTAIDLRASVEKMENCAYGESVSTEERDALVTIIKLAREVVDWAEDHRTGAKQTDAEIVRAAVEVDE